MPLSKQQKSTGITGNPYSETGRKRMNPGDKVYTIVQKNRTSKKIIAKATIETVHKRIKSETYDLRVGGAYSNDLPIFKTLKDAKEELSKEYKEKLSEIESITENDVE